MTINTTMNTAEETIKVTAAEAEQEAEAQRRKESDQLLQPETILPLVIANLCKFIKDGLVHTTFSPELTSICPSYQLETNDSGEEIEGSRISDLSLSVTLMNTNGFSDTFTCNLSLIGDDGLYTFNKNSKAASHILSLFKQWVDVFALKQEDGTKQSGPKLSEEIKQARAALIEQGRELKGKKEKKTKQLLVEARKEQDAQNVRITNLNKQLEQAKAESVANVIQYAQSKKQTVEEELKHLQAYQSRFFESDGVLMLIVEDEVVEADEVQKIDYHYLDDQINNCKARITANEKLAAYMQTVSAQKEQVELLEAEKVEIIRKRGEESLLSVQAVSDATEWDKVSVTVGDIGQAANTEEIVGAAA